MDSTAFNTALAKLAKRDIESFMEQHSECFDQLLWFAISDDQPHAWRAAWILCSIMVPGDARVQHFVGPIVGALTNKTDGHTRELLRVLMLMELAEEHAGKVFDFCVQVWQNPMKSPGLRMNALKMLVKIADRFPELLPEVLLLLNYLYVATLSSGAMRSAERIRQNLPSIEIQ